MSMTISQKLDKVRGSIKSHISRGQGLGFNGNVNRRGCDLADKYNDLKKQHNNTVSYGEHSSEWKNYCDKRNLDYDHNGQDLFA